MIIQENYVEELCEALDTLAITAIEGQWHTGIMTIHGQRLIFKAKIYSAGSVFGIDEGRISKLYITSDDKCVCGYDRGWDVTPTSDEARLAYDVIVHEFN